MTDTHTIETKRVDLGQAGVLLCESLLDAATGFGKLPKETVPKELLQYIADAVYKTAPREEGEGVNLDEFTAWGQAAFRDLTSRVTEKVRELGGDVAVDLIDAIVETKRKGGGHSVH